MCCVCLKATSSTFVESDETEEAEETEGRASRRTLVVDVVGDEREANDERARYVNEIYVCGQVALQLDSNYKTGVGSLIGFVFFFVSFLFLFLLLLLLLLLGAVRCWCVSE